MLLRRCVLVVILALAFALRARAQEKFALAVYHFNIQYVQGGLTGFPDGNNTDPAFALDDQQVMDRLIDQSFEPLLDIYARHPTWGADIELQGYMLEVLQKDRPAVLAKLKALADAGHVAVDSFHYADQLWLAYPRRDEEASYDLTLEAFAATGIKHGTSVWTQEGQWAPGEMRFMKERGLGATILPHNLFGWVHPQSTPAPLYKFGDGYCITDGETSDAVLHTKFTFADDGEKAVTNDEDPYLGTHFTTDPASVAAKEQELEDLESQGWHISSVADYVKAAVALEPNPPELPEMIDGTWQPKNTDNLALWMGDGGLLNALGSEADNAVLTTNARVGRLVREAESVANELGDKAMQAKVKSAWKALLLGEGSDATGWNPWRGERDYAITHAQAAEDLANAVLKDSKVAPRLEPASVTPKLVDATAPFAVTPEIPATSSDDATPTRTATTTWKQRQGTTTYELAITFSASKGPRTIGVSFPRSIDRLVVTQALEDDTVVDIPLDDIAADDGQGGAMPVTAALPNGLVALGDDTFLILDLSTIHLAARLPKDEEVVRFTDMTAPSDAVTWKFVVVKGTKDQALAEATALNVAPAEVLGAAPAGCGCGSSTASLALLPLVLLLMRRRRVA